MATIQDLLAYASAQARIERIDYFDPRYPRADEVAAWRRDCGRRSYYRAQLRKTWPGRWRSSEQLVPGRYFGTRLVITADEIDYTPGQYAPLEIWQAVADYFRQTNELEA